VAPTQIGFDVAEERALICESYFHLVFLSLYNPLEPLMILNFTRTENSRSASKPSKK
jgi:hypothetical protein